MHRAANIMMTNRPSLELDICRYIMVCFKINQACHYGKINTLETVADKCHIGTIILMFDSYMDNGGESFDYRV